MTRADDETREYLRVALVPACAVDDSEMTIELLRYLVAFCSYASKRNDGRCWVAQTKVARRLGVSRQAVSTAALALSGLGYMQVQGEWSQENGKQLTNTYWINLNMTIPAERDRSTQPRKRAGVGGMPYHQSRKKSDSAHVAPATHGVAPPATHGVAPPATHGVAPPATHGVAQNTESEYGKGIRRGKGVHAHAGTPHHTQKLAEPEEQSQEPAPLTFTLNAWTALTKNGEAVAWLRAHGHNPDTWRYTDMLRAYTEYWEAHP